MRPRVPSRSVVAYTMPFPGHVYSFVPILDELRRRGHEVSLWIAAPEPTPPAIEGIPVRWMPWPEALVPEVGLLYGPTAAKFARLGRTFASLGEPLARSFELGLFEQEPHVLLVDPMMWGAMVVAEAGDIPWASIAYEPTFIRGRGLDVRGPGFRPPRYWWERMGHRIYGVGQHVATLDHLRLVNAARHARGLAPLSRLKQLYLRAPLTIALTIEPFEYPRDDWPESLHFIGPTLWEPGSDVGDGTERSQERPLILVVGSTVSDQSEGQEWIDVTIEALAAADYEVVATVPGGRLPTSPLSNVSIARYAPHGRLLPRAACVVCHGGIGIVQKALTAGVPVVVIPTRWFDVARRVEVAGVGTVLEANGVTPNRVLAAVQTAIYQCGGAASRIAEAFRAAGGAPAAVDAIESLPMPVAGLRAG